MIPELANISLRKAVLAFLSLVGVTVIMLVVLKAAGTERLQNMVAQMGPWAPAVYIVLKASTYIVAPLSGSPLHVSAGALFGLGYGTLYSLAGDVLGGCANFWISRLLGRRMIVRFVGQQGMSRIDGLYRQLGGWRALLFARLFLSSVYDFISYAAGLTSLAFRRYLMVTSIGGIVPTLLFVAIGASVAENRRMLLLAYGGLAMLCLVPLVLHRRVRGASRPDEMSFRPSRLIITCRGLQAGTGGPTGLARLRGVLEGDGMHKPLTRLRQRVYRCSLTKNIGGIEAIDELLAEATNEQDTALLEQLRAKMDDYRRHQLRPR